MGLGDVQAAPACIFQARPWGGARPLTPQVVGGKQSLWGDPSGVGVPSHRGLGQAQDPGQKGFSGSSPLTGGKGLGRPRAGGSAARRPQTGTPAEGRLGAAGRGGSPLTGSHGPSYRQLHSRRTASCGPASRGGGGRAPGGRPREAGAGRGGWDHLGAAGVGVGGGGGGLAWRWEGAAGRGQAGTPNLSPVPSSEWRGPSSSRGGRRLGVVHLYVVSMSFA